MTQLNPYLTFDGNCREAMTFYQECLGGELSIQSVGETAVSNDFAAGDQNKVMHAYLGSNGVVLMGSDRMDMGESAPGAKLVATALLNFLGLIESALERSHLCKTV